MNARLQAIKKAFKDNGIILKEELDDSKKHEMKESITNQFMKVEDKNGNQYLIRINGNLWPPFTREGEDYNLKKLKDSNINTTVIVNNTELGFQICRLQNDKNRFSEMPADDKKENLLTKISLAIKKFHRISHFKNHYPVEKTINSSLNRLPETEQKKLSLYHGAILRILNTLNADEKNQVSSHNDLLPSSIYLDKNQISFVDWEYSAENHRSYDLSLFSIKSFLTPEQERKLITAYDTSGDLDMQYSVMMMKPVVNFLLLLWNLSSKKSDPIAANILLHSLTISTQDAIYQQASRTLLSEMQFCFFYNNNPHDKSASHENVPTKYLS